MTDEPITGQMTVDECIRLAEIDLLAATQDPVSGCIASCDSAADCEIAGCCLQQVLCDVDYARVKQNTVVFLDEPR